MKVKLKDGIREYSENMSILDIASDISDGLKRMACCATVDGKVVDLRENLNNDCELVINTFNDEVGKETHRHTCAHVLAYAVKRLYKDAKLTIGPAIEQGFYYDFDMQSVGREELDEIEKEMKKIIKENPKITKFSLPYEEALKLMEEKNEPYKVEMIKELGKDEEITFYTMGDDFVDLCRGPHLIDLKQIKAFKLISSSSAYWRGNQANQSLTRIYGISFTKKEDLKAHLEYLENIKKRDHNKLGREMKLFTTVDVIGQGLPLLLPRGAKIVQTLQRWIEDEEEKRGYLLTKTPLFAKSDLYKISGHWQHYKDGMFVIGEENDDKEVFALRPMTCPFQYYCYKQGSKSYRDLPIKYAETSTLFRNEESGEMHGLTRVRQFTLADAHIIVTPEQVSEEFIKAVELASYVIKTLGLEKDVTYRLSKWDESNKEKYIGTPELWEETQGTIRNILEKLELPYYEADGEAAFYGPKLDIQTRNVYGKEDTMFTVQLDFSVAEKFEMTYIDKNGEKKYPYIIHRSSIGCYERTLATLIEKYEGHLPTWMMDEQVRILPLSDKYLEYAKIVKEKLDYNKIRCSIDGRTEKLGYKIREARLDRIPYMIIVGEKEMENNEVSVRSYYAGDEGTKALDIFVKELKIEIDDKIIREVTNEE